MRQEDYNDMMRYPGEVKRAKPNQLPPCPMCGELYSGDGVKLCVECEAEYVREMKDAERRAEFHAEMRRDAFGEI